MLLNPEVYLMNERPEEVTDMQRSVRGEVIASTLTESLRSMSRLLISFLKKQKISGMRS
jgi:transcription termination factor Rho